MKTSLLLLSAVAILGLIPPASAQYIYMDVNGDGVCTSSDAILSTTTSVDIYLDTSHDYTGRAVTCDDGTNSLDIGSYDIILHKIEGGSLVYGAWTNAMAGYSVLNPPTVAGLDFGVGYTAPATFDPPGLYKLGTLAITVNGGVGLQFLTSPPPGIPSPVTGFGSHCSGSVNPNTITLGEDFFTACGTAVPVAVEATTWGRIKMTYR